MGGGIGEQAPARTQETEDERRECHRSLQEEDTEQDGRQGLESGECCLSEGSSRERRVQALETGPLFGERGQQCAQGQDEEHRYGDRGDRPCPQGTIGCARHDEEEQPQEGVGDEDVANEEEHRMRQTKEEERTQPAQKAPPIRRALVAQDERRAVAEEE